MLPGTHPGDPRCLNRGGDKEAVAREQKTELSNQKGELLESGRFFVQEIRD
jgi:hypothetical protein